MVNFGVLCNKNMNIGGKIWTKEEDLFLFENYIKFGAKYCANLLSVSPPMVYQRCQTLKIKKCESFIRPEKPLINILISWEEFDKLNHRDMIPFRCCLCGKEHSKIKQHIKKAIKEEYKYLCCSIKCQGKMQTKHFLDNNPTKDNLVLLINKDFSVKEISETYNKDYYTILSLLKIYELKTNRNFRKTGKIHKKTKKLMSVSMREHLLNHPEHYFWKDNKHISIPCEKLKQELRNKNIEFKEEIKVLLHLGYLYSADIVFEQYGVIIEVNGKQHYSDWKKKILAPNYQKRHNLLVENGWRVFEIPSNEALCFNFWNEIFPQIFNKTTEPSMEYKDYLNKHKGGNKTKSFPKELLKFAE